MASATGKFTGFTLSCPFCRSADDTLLLNLNDLTECHCSDCEETFSPAQARDLAAAEVVRWEAVVRWIGLAAPATGD
jgi:hypothetical protein